MLTNGIVKVQIGRWRLPIIANQTFSNMRCMRCRTWVKIHINDAEKRHICEECKCLPMECTEGDIVENSYISQIQMAKFLMSTGLIFVFAIKYNGPFVKQPFKSTFLIILCYD